MFTGIEHSVDIEAVINLYDRYVMHTYSRQPVVFVRGSGMKVWDSAGKEYLDFLAGIAVNGLGHAHPDVTAAVVAQATELVHVSNLYYVPQQAFLAKRLVELSGLGKAFFCNSGTEANEAAIKLARKWAKLNRGPHCFEIITAEGSFHGRTLASLTATGQPKYHKGFEPLVPGFKYVPFNDLESLRAAVGDSTCAIMLEPIQGESGVHPATLEYLLGARELCTKLGILFILDEVQTGIGRTGRWFGHEHYGVKPDIMTLAKTLGGGIPIGACLAIDSVAAAFESGNHAATFGGNPLACAAALTTLDIIERENLVLNAAETGAYFRQSLETLCNRRSDISEVRGTGLMLAIELARIDAPNIVASCLRSGLLLGAVGNSVIRFLPPLIVQRDDIDRAIAILEYALSETPE